MKFTQVIKDNWLANLRSGKYVQGFGALVEGTMEKPTYCCIGVLGDCTKGLSADEEDNHSETNPYRFLENNIGIDETNNIWVANDDADYQELGKTDYSNVIPLIEALPVQE